MNGLFFSDSTMHKIYVDQGAYDFIYQIPQILYSTIISSVIGVIIKLLSLVEKVSKVLKCLLIKFVLFYGIFYEFVFMFLLLFWYFLSCFGAVYKNTQMH